MMSTLHCMLPFLFLFLTPELRDGDTPDIGLLGDDYEHEYPLTFLRLIVHASILFFLLVLGGICVSALCLLLLDISSPVIGKGCMRKVA